MRKNILSIIVIMTVIIPSIAMAGRHSIARDEASRIVENRFAQFYRDEATRKQAEQRAMEQEILKAKDIEAAMLRELEQNMANQSKIKSADELEQNMQRELADLNNDNDAAALTGNDAEVNHNIASHQDHTFFDLKAGSKENNPFLFLQDLHHASPTKRAAGIQEVVESLQSLPDHHKLSEEFARDLAKISPEMAREFSAAYKESLLGSKTKSFQNTPKEDLSKSTSLGTSSDKNNDNKAKQEAVGVVDGKDLKKNIREHFKLQDHYKPQAFNAVTKYSFSPNKLYQIYTAPHKVTLIALAPGEKIVGAPICGDLVKWKINAINATGNIGGQHLTIQPLRADITTSITIATNQGRLYLLEATSLKNNYMAVVRWSYEF